ncbi:MAG: YdcF family protein [Rickettsiaceae bacterium]|nr:MAG: YdcF family protein [Rickettsiaceae bacterium]
MRLILKLIIITLFLWLAGAVYYIWYTQSDEVRDFAQTQAIVLYAGGGIRTNVGIELLKAGYSPVLFIAGISSSSQLKNYLIENGVKPERVIYGHFNVKTPDNAAEIAEFVLNHDLSSIRLVAFAYQMPRVLEELSILLPSSVKISTYPIKTSSWQLVDSFIEYNKYLVKTLLKYVN